MNHEHSTTNKVKYGDVSTDDKLIHMILDNIPRNLLNNPTLTWLDPACGKGNFMIALLHRLMISLTPIFPNTTLRRQHILTKMLYMIEINQEYIPFLKQKFPGSNIIQQDFLTFSQDIPFDCIIGNPPFNSLGLKKVPTNTNRNKKEDGKTIWPSFVRHAISLLRENGLLSFILPSIWMKPDKAQIYPLLTHYYLEKIRCFTNTETNQLFHGNAQTPTCFFSLYKKSSPVGVTSLYDSTIQHYIPYLFSPNEPLPVFGASIFAKLRPYVKMYGTPDFIKTNMAPKNVTLSRERTDTHSYKNIRTCILKDNIQPTLVYEYSSSPLIFSGEPKLVLAHKMYGFPYYDRYGDYGISRRDNYVLLNQTRSQYERWRDFLSTKFALYLFEGTRYRMKYLERYVFQLIPDITKIPHFPIVINDEQIATFFQLTDKEKKGIYSLHQKNYKKH